jgi:endoglucanase Acf2
LDNPEKYPSCGTLDWGFGTGTIQDSSPSLISVTGIFQCRDQQDYTLTVDDGQTWLLITLQPKVDQQLQTCRNRQQLTVWGKLNQSGQWLVVEKLESTESQTV